jgi:two-component system sensor histidine kinase KdpD
VLPGINPTTAGFALLLAVLLVATRAPRGVAFATAIAGALSFNYFFVPPVGTFAITGTANWVSWFAFLIAAVAGSNLSAAARERARIAVERAQFVEEREAAELARQRGELATTLLASLSHDVKTPLTAIRAAIENLRREQPAESRTRQADAALAELIRLTNVFDGLMDMARIDAAAVPVQREWVTPADVVDVAVAHVRHALGGHELRVNATTDRAVHLDARLAAKALSHLLENAARYSPPGGEIAVDATADDEGFTAIVTDQGPGFDPADSEHLFERFYRGRHTKPIAGGTGMGLAIARGLVQAIGGRVWAENVPGAGARFAIVVPAQARALEVPA